MVSFQVIFILFLNLINCCTFFLWGGYCRYLRNLMIFEPIKMVFKIFLREFLAKNKKTFFKKDALNVFEKG